jgi:hypothetical protein
MKLDPSTPPACWMPPTSHFDAEPVTAFLAILEAPWRLPSEKCDSQLVEENLAQSLLDSRIHNIVQSFYISSGLQQPEIVGFG